jgi:Type IV secretion-system coupling protein DNA-binding domain
LKTKLRFLTEEGHTRARNTFQRVRLFGVLMFLLAGPCGFAIHYYWVWPSLTPLQRIYLRQYMRSTVKSYVPRSRSRYTFMAGVVRDPETGDEIRIMVPDGLVIPEFDQEGRIKVKDRYPVFHLKANVPLEQCTWVTEFLADATVYEQYRHLIYEDKSIIDLWRPAWLGAIMFFLTGTSGLTGLYLFAQRRYVAGQPLRGTRELSPRQYRREHRKHTGYALTAYPQVMNLLARVQAFFGFKQRSYTLTVPREEENEGMLLLGDPGTGKSQIMHQFIDEIVSRERFEAIVIYDPVGEFLEQHYDPDTDIILNPLDARCPYWNPVDEIENVTDETSAPERYFIAESFFPDHPHSSPTTQFFNKAARSIFAHLLGFNPSPERLVQMLTDEELIDACVAGTEHAHLIDRAAKAQRAGVLATLSEVGASLKLLPTLEQCDGRRFTFREWAQRRRRCIFITSTQSTREALRRTHAAWFNILFGKLMGTSLTTSGQRPCWVMIDEAHSLKRLPALETALVEARKYRVKIVLGTQNKTQIEQSYERISATMLAASHTKSFGRINESDSARWVSDMIGQQEIERPRVSTTSSVQAYGRDSLNYAPGIEHNSVVSKEQIMALPNLHFYWKYGDAVVPFRIDPIGRPKRAAAFVPRQPRPVGEPRQTLPAHSPAKANEHEQVDELEITPQDADPLDTRF